MVDFDKAIDLIKNNDVKLKMFLKDRMFLLNKKDLTDTTLLHHSVNANNINAVKLLLDLGADVNSIDINRWTALYIAVWNNNIPIVKLLFDYGADPNITEDIYNQTPLQYAVEKKNISMIKLLLLYGADINVKNNFGEAPLDQIKNEKLKNELIFIYNNRDKIINNLKRKEG